MEKKNLGVTILAQAEMIKGASDEEALCAVKTYFPEAKTTKGSIESMRSRLRRKKNVDVPTSADARRKPNLRLVG